MFSKSIRSTKRTLGDSDLVLARWDSESVFDRPLILLSLFLIPQTIFMKWFHTWLIFRLVTMFYLLYVMSTLTPRLLGCEFLLFIFIIFCLVSLTELLSAHTRVFHPLQVNLLLVSWSGGVVNPLWWDSKV